MQKLPFLGFSRWGQTRLMYNCFHRSSSRQLKFLTSIPRALLAFDAIFVTCLVYLRSDVKIIPRSLSHSDIYKLILYSVLTDGTYTQKNGFWFDFWFSNPKPKIFGFKNKKPKFLVIIDSKIKKLKRSLSIQTRRIWKSKSRESWTNP